VKHFRITINVAHTLTLTHSDTKAHKLATSVCVMCVCWVSLKMVALSKALKSKHIIHKYH